MTKAKLTDAVKPSAVQTDEKVKAETKTESNPATPAGDQKSSVGDDDDDDGDDPDAASGETAPADKNPPAGGSSATKTLADFRASFGKEQGSVYWADSVSFEDACVAHMTAQAATIAAQVTEIAALKKAGADMAAKLKGEDEPLATAKPDKTTAAGQDAVSSFAAAAEERLKKTA